jgi:hypothetical protein
MSAFQVHELPPEFVPQLKATEGMTVITSQSEAGQRFEIR